MKYVLFWKKSSPKGGLPIGCYDSQSEAQTQADLLSPPGESHLLFDIREMSDQDAMLCARYNVVIEPDGSKRAYIHNIHAQGRNYTAYKMKAEKNRYHPDKKMQVVYAYSYQEAIDMADGL